MLDKCLKINQGVIFHLSHYWDIPSCLTIVGGGMLSPLLVLNFIPWTTWENMQCFKVYSQPQPMQLESIELYLTVLNEGLAQIKHDLKTFKYSVCPFWHVKIMTTSQTLQVLFSLFWMSALGGRTARRSTVGASFSWEWHQMRDWFGQINLLQN